MIYVTQGHEKSISLEIFLKACLQLSNEQLKKVCLICDPNSLKETLGFLGFDYLLKDSSLHFYDLDLKLCPISSKPGLSQSQLALEMGIKLCQEDDILLTLPTSKDQLHFNGALCAGHTEFFRSHFKNADLAMVFRDDHFFHLLLTDHVPLDKVSSLCTSEFITRKVEITLEGLKRYFNKPHFLYFAGINPHAGEDGILGDDKEVFARAFKTLKSSHSDIEFVGPLSGDTLHNLQAPQGDSLFIYSAHDQALAPFKQKNRFWGSNITLGLPFLRLSVDHGTAFNLYGKNMANSLGCFDNLVFALKVHG